ncbi:glycine receptor subunit alpha-3-like [Centruroides sculpturatus]|uniref:glycine receptor subunit alpha-3-like n=1 Tax=Centruroides sculpturatus TaxID=218467 RepID=UPI000C6E0B27|nr:glycine receptor subunit alpha-3-like [Centruroides sculpturatus]
MSASFQRGKYLLDVIPDDYDKHTPPVVDGKPVVVYVNLQIMDVDEIRERTMDFRMHLYQNEFWKDPRLKLNLLNLTRIKVLPPIAEKLLWIPDLVFGNSKSGQLFQFSLPNTAIKINKDETIQKVSRYSFRVSCPMNLNNYPLDTQHCVFKISSMCNDGKKLILDWSDAESSPYKVRGPSIILLEDIQPLKYEMKVPKPRRVTEIWLRGNYSCLMANFTFVRRVTSSLINTYFPSSLVVALSWLSFWLHVNAVPARITLGVTSILTLTTQIAQSRSYTPSVNYIKALDIWLFVCTFFVTASLLEYALSYQLNVYQPKL